MRIQASYTRELSKIHKSRFQKSTEKRKAIIARGLLCPSQRLAFIGGVWEKHDKDGVNSFQSQRPKNLFRYSMDVFCYFGQLLSHPLKTPKTLILRFDGRLFPTLNHSRQLEARSAGEYVECEPDAD